MTEIGFTDKHRERNPRYRIRHRILSSDTDFMRELRISKAFVFFQDIAADHAESLGAGVTQLVSERGVAWILMRMRLEIERMPFLDETVYIETWPRGYAPLYERDYRITDMNGDCCINASSVWIIMDLEKREIMKENLVPYEGVVLETERTISAKLRQLKAPGTQEPILEKDIMVSDIDYNGHINNTRYVDFVCDCIGRDFMSDNRLKAIEVNYINEAYYAEKLRLFKGDCDDGAIYIEGRSGEDERTVFKAKAEFEPR